MIKFAGRDRFEKVWQVWKFPAVRLGVFNLSDEKLGEESLRKSAGERQLEQLTGTLFALGVA
jgi:hypothetical protein